MSQAREWMNEAAQAASASANPAARQVQARQERKSA
jgi:hypothetical protein